MLKVSTGRLDGGRVECFRESARGHNEGPVAGPIGCLIVPWEI